MNGSPLIYWCTLRTCWVMTRLSVKMAVNLMPPTNACPRFRKRPCQLNKSFFPKVLSPCELCIVTFFLLSLCNPSRICLCAFWMCPPLRENCHGFLVNDLSPPSASGLRCPVGRHLSTIQHHIFFPCGTHWEDPASSSAKMDRHSCPGWQPHIAED